MREQLVERLKNLKNEFESGQKMLADLEARQENMKTVLHRISGAIQVLEEELAKAGQASEVKDQELIPGAEKLKEASG